MCIRDRSGMHIAVLWGLLCWILRPLDRSCLLRWVKCGIIVLLLWTFAFLVGLPPSVIRAVVMCMLMTVAVSYTHLPFASGTVPSVATRLIRCLILELKPNIWNIRVRCVLPIMGVMRLIPSLSLIHIYGSWLESSCVGLI